MRPRVLVTRPEPGASATARRLEEVGFSPVVMPLSETLALPVDVSAIPHDMDAVAVTSANAIRHASDDLIASLAGRRLFAVGRKTAKAAREAGFASVIEGSGDAVGLADQILAELPAGSRILYLTGRVRLDHFERRIAESGLRVFVKETYDTRRIDYPEEAVASLLAGGQIDAVLLYSAKAAEALSGLAGQPGMHSLFATARYFCLSDRVAASLNAAEKDRISIAAEPTEDALLSLLKADR
ncbi:uroporphyrinogen-III synthase [Mesorhizobium sp. YR577]|uniref:uroporphyrinogen-III synthase n=1 Tax=Mesorhizobium sp. YR577 TaxID=1884373 RepID=UPI0008ED1CA7|nr:uroporphyrinogen-III synthase [Mesorhizobium sp. YR577]SFT39956.1 uroporphyrinogen-III synthase [Mesorhizobium sp. YR577]